ncbi:MinD/ParA family ATP-binding protein [Goodfellowiella coeruleoviolacea]|nr:ParA family protein [Goodfellowiella coeruleoviolacea]
MSQDTFIQPPRLYTWVDIDEYFRDLSASRGWPEWLLEVSAYWDSVEFTLARSVDDEEVWRWMRLQLGPLTVDPHRELILLESVDADRGLPVVLKLADAVDANATPQRRPEWNERHIIRALGEPLPAPQQETFPHDVAIAAFHSFKGGSGRTVHCVALAREIAAQPGRRVLLVDADLEAPGITWMVHEQGIRIEFSFEDFIALLHGSSDGNITEAIALARKFLVNQELDGVFVLPARRNPRRLNPPRIQPLDLLTQSRSPYFLTESLAELGHSLGVGSVLIDLRAGASELSAPMMLDPRAHRVFATTINHQSVQGTVQLLRELARRAPGRREHDPVPTVLITQFHTRNHGEQVAKAASELGKAVAEAARLSDSTGQGIEEDVTSELLASDPLTSPFNLSLLALPASWNEVGEEIENADLRNVVRDLADQLRPVPKGTQEDHQDDGEEELDLDELRRMLAHGANQLKYAETASEESDFLRTDSLVNLVSAHRTDAPIEVVVGAKGSGKTFTYLTMCRRESWSQFADALGVAGVELSAPLVPVFWSRNLRDSAESVQAVQRKSARELSGAEPRDSLQLIQENLKRDLTEPEWRRLWLRCLAGAAGLDSTEESVEDDLVKFASEHQAVFVVDGLEDLFQDFNSDRREQQALRALLTGCPEWLRALRNRPLGLVIFVRRDLVQNSVRQNSGQFFAKYQNYELRWNRTEALRLVAWVGNQTRALPLPDGMDVQSASEAALTKHLLKLWGERLGSVRSKEARSQEWFLAALSDFNQQIQARDIVWFLAEAASLSASEGGAASRSYADRLLIPLAMRRALPACSSAKISEIEKENPQVGALFHRLQRVNEDAKKVPFDPEVVRLSLEDIALLITNGVVFQDEKGCWMPEIYRQGLGFRAGGRPRVLGVAKLVRRRNDFE